MKARNVMNALAVALLLSSNANTQIQISGKVYNEKNEPVSGATVQIIGQNIGTETSQDGYFVIKDLKAGNYTLKAAMIDYVSQEKRIHLKENSELNFILKNEIYFLEGIEVKGIRAEKNTPTTYTNISSEDIEKQNFGQDFPFLLSKTPSTVVTSDAGTGIGYTGYRIRGVDPTSTNVTVNGIPINDAESQSVFWVNMPDFSSSVESVQIQRGVGTSSNGSGAFGASINISSDEINHSPYTIIDNSGGSFNTIRNSIKVGTGLLPNNFIVDARVSNIQSDGYIDRASADLQSFYLSGAYRGEKSTIRFNVFGGKEKTYQAWYGTPESRVKNDEQGMLDYAARNGLSEAATDNLLNSGRTYNAYTYDNETDNYQQTHYQLHFSHRFNKNWNMKMAGHYTRGAGYYENYRENDRLSTYNINPVVLGQDTINRMNLIRRKWLDNHFGGVVFNIDYNNLKGLEIILGGAFNVYDGDHFGTIPWGEYMTTVAKDYEYYNNHSTKYDGNIYLKANYQIKNFNFFADAQYRHIDYSFLGIDDYGGKIIDIQHRVFYNFFNPKIGVLYQINSNHSVYTSYAVANREPVRDDFKETTSANRPKYETLYDLEAGYRINSKKYFLSTNIYWMNYDNQLILTGQINDVGGYTKTNVKNSYRLGFEMEGGIQPLKQLGISANLGLSQNKIKDFVEFIDSYDENWSSLPQTKIEHGTKDLAFSPTIISGFTINYAPVSSVNIDLTNKYVGKQFLDNTSNDTRSIDAYFVSHLTASYSFSLWKIKEVVLSGQINNLWNELYENNGYTFSYLVGNDRIQENFYYPQAGRSYMLRLLLKL